MTEDQEKALELYVRNFADNILRLMQRGFITFQEAIYLLQSDLAEVAYSPHGYCAAQGIVYGKGDH